MTWIEVLYLKGRKSRGLLLKNEEDLTEEETGELEELLKESPCLRIAYELKEELREIYLAQYNGKNRVVVNSNDTIFKKAKLVKRLIMSCPNCHSSKFVKNGHTHYGKQRFRCRDCGRQFVNNPSRQPISQEKRDLIDKLLKERLALAAMASPAPEAHRASY